MNKYKYFIIGLGNSYEKYKETRHNLGTLLLDNIAKLHYSSIKWLENNKFNIKMLSITINKVPCMLLKSIGYINENGLYIGNFLKYFKICEKKILIIHDDLNINFGEIKVSVNKPSTHNGVLSFYNNFSKNILRLRIGIKPIKKSNIKTCDYVLGSLTCFEKKIFFSKFNMIINTINSIILNKKI